MHRHPSRSGASAPSRSVAPFHRGPQAVAPVTSPNIAPPAHAPNAALLIDFDNVTMGIRSDLQDELKNLLSSDIIKGKVAVRRAYADWRRYPQYIVPLTEASIDLIFAPAYGSSKKNATDIRLAIDALELVFTRPEIGTFVLLSGDSDFSSMVIKLKEYGKYVIGVGIRESSSDLLVMNCDEYYSYNALAGLVKSGEDETTRWDPWQLVTEAVARMKRDGDVMRSDRLKQVMQEIDASFDEKNLGHPKFSRFVLEAQNRGLLRVNKLESGQLEVDVADDAAPTPVTVAATPPVNSEPRRDAERDDRRRRGRRGRGRDRSEKDREVEGSVESVVTEGVGGTDGDAGLVAQADASLSEAAGTRAVSEAGAAPERTAAGAITALPADIRTEAKGRAVGVERPDARGRRRDVEAPRPGDDAPDTHHGEPQVGVAVDSRSLPTALGVPLDSPVVDMVGQRGERLTRSGAFELVRKAVESLVRDDAATSASAARQRAYELLGRDSESLSIRMFERILQDAHDAGLVDLRRRGNDWEVARATDAASIVDQLRTADDARKATQAAAQPLVPRGMGARGIGGRVTGRGKAAVPPELLMVGVVTPRSSTVDGSAASSADGIAEVAAGGMAVVAAEQVSADAAANVPASVSAATVKRGVAEPVKQVTAEKSPVTPKGRKRMAKVAKTPPVEPSATKESPKKVPEPNNHVTDARTGRSHMAEVPSKAAHARKTPAAKASADNKSVNGKTSSARQGAKTAAKQPVATGGGAVAVRTTASKAAKKTTKAASRK